MAILLIRWLFSWCYCCYPIDTTNTQPTHQEVVVQPPTIPKEIVVKEEEQIVKADTIIEIDEVLERIKNDIDSQHSDWESIE